MTRVAIVHDWLTGMRGGEKCLEVFCELFAHADIYTLLHIPTTVSPLIERHRIHTSFIQNLPGAQTRYRHYLPLFPKAIESFKLTDYDLVLSSSHCVAKGIIPPPGAKHICYCYTPMRYAWDMRDVYFPSTMPYLKRKLIHAILKYLRRWDTAVSDRVDEFIAISHHVADRIQRHYHRPSEVIYPPVDTASFTLSNEHDDYYLIVSAFAPYKKIDIAIDAFNRLGYELVIVGTGQDEAKLKARANSNIRFIGWASDESVRHYYSRCRAFIFPGEEDFGITPLEAMACGKPVIAYNRGGVTETVIGYTPTAQQYTGVLFDTQTPQALCEAVQQERRIAFSPSAIRERALLFDRNVFKNNIRKKLHSFISE